MQQWRPCKSSISLLGKRVSMAGPVVGRGQRPQWLVLVTPDVYLGGYFVVYPVPPRAGSPGCPAAPGETLEVPRCLRKARYLSRYLGILDAAKHLGSSFSQWHMFSGDRGL